MNASLKRQKMCHVRQKKEKKSDRTTSKHLQLIAQSAVVPLDQAGISVQFRVKVWIMIHF